MSSGGTDRAYRDALVRRFKLDADKKVRSLSKGNRQKVQLIATWRRGGIGAACSRARMRAASSRLSNSFLSSSFLNCCCAGCSFRASGCQPFSAGLSDALPLSYAVDGMHHLTRGPGDSGSVAGDVFIVLALAEAGARGH